MAGGGRRPLVGVTCFVEQVRWGVWDYPAALLPLVYVDAVSRAGGRAVLLPPDDVDAGVVDALDGLVVSGGSDIDPARYGAERDPRTDEPRPDRDAGELTLLREAVARDLPTLGICRGMQLMAVAAGGSLIQHLPDVVGHDDHRPTPGVYGAHNARFAPGSRVAAVLGPETKVNAHHHQGVADPGRLVATGWADDDVIEAVEDPARRFLLGVQWHPEATEDHRLFAALVDAARGPGGPGARTT